MEDFFRSRVIPALRDLIRGSPSREKMDVECFDCAVCWNKQPVDFSVACTKFEVPEFEEVETDSEDSDTDNSDASDSEVDITQEVEEPKEDKMSDEKPHVAHLFCSDCIQAAAQNACLDTPLAKGGVGLRCMENNCDGVLLLSSFRKFLSPELLTRLEDRMQHETIIHAKIENLERCLKCNYGQIMHNRPFRRRNLKFACEECGAAHCRLCKVPWKQLHAGKTCWEYRWINHARYGWNKTATPEFVDNETAMKLTENLIRTCPKCNLSFLKTHGCNFLKCRCGAAQCYSCREQNIGYDHFCNCSSVKTSKKCCNKCDLFDDVKARERRERDDLLRSAKRRHEATTEPNSSGSTHHTTAKRHATRSTKKH